MCAQKCRFIGYRPGDPTAATPPAAMPAATVRPPPGGLKTLDLCHMTMAQLHAEAAATQTRDLFAALLPDPPGAWAVAGWAHGVTQKWPGQAQQACCDLNTPC